MAFGLIVEDFNQLGHFYIVRSYDPPRWSPEQCLQGPGTRVRLHCPFFPRTVRFGCAVHQPLHDSSAPADMMAEHMGVAARSCDDPLRRINSARERPTTQHNALSAFGRCLRNTAPTCRRVPSPWSHCHVVLASNKTAALSRPRLSVFPCLHCIVAPGTSTTASLLDPAQAWPRP